MAEGTSIEWTHRPGTIPATLNALVGCQKVSQGCAHCYAIEVANVRAGNPLPIMQEKFAGTVRTEGGKRVWTGKVTLTMSALLAPLRKKKPRTYFVNALSDLFYDGVPDEWIDRHFAVFALCPQHTFIVLTKRPERMRTYLRQVENANPYLGRWQKFADDLVDNCAAVEAKRFPLPNVWLGVSVEDQRTADERIPLLLRTPAAVRFISAEPLLGGIDFRRRCPAMCTGECGYPSPYELLGAVLPGNPLIDWVISGGESGPGARPMHPDWARGLRDQCVAAGVPFFFKQWGVYKNGSDFAKNSIAVLSDGRTCDGSREQLEALDRVEPVAPLSPTMMRRVGKKAAGDLLDGRQWHEFPVVQSVRPLSADGMAARQLGISLRQLRSLGGRERVTALTPESLASLLRPNTGISRTLKSGGLKARGYRKGDQGRGVAARLRGIAG